MSYTIENVKDLIHGFCLSHKMNCSFSELNINGGHAVFVFDNCIMGVSYCSEEWSPYYLTSIEVRSLDEDVPATHQSQDLIYFYYDDTDDTIIDLESSLNEAFRYASNFNMSLLYRHIGENCGLVGDWRHGLHPDDTENESLMCKKEYKCVGTFAQYFILSEGTITIRELDRYISWKNG